MDLFDLDTEAVERVLESLDVGPQIVPIVKRAELVSKGDLRIEERVETMTDLPCIDFRFEDSPGGVEVGLRHVRSIALDEPRRSAFNV